jgi:formate hydrogenlyase subunit 4
LPRRRGAPQIDALHRAADGGAQVTYAINLAVPLLLAPLVEGIIRKLRAKIHSRQGPPVTQPYRDILKLLVKEDLEGASNWMVRIAPALGLAAVLVAALLAPMGFRPPMAEGGDMIAFVYVAGLSTVAVILGGMASASPYAYLGAGREMMMHMIVEPVLLIGLLAAAVKCGSLQMWPMAIWNAANGPALSLTIAGVAVFLAVQAQVGKLPFDIPEADSELMGGPYIEMSGPKLALFRWAFSAKLVVFGSVLVAIFVPWGATFPLPLAVLAHVAKLLVLAVLVCLVDVVNPRLRIDQALVYYFGVIFVAITGLAFALIGA